MKRNEEETIVAEWSLLLPELWQTKIFDEGWGKVHPRLYDGHRVMHLLRTATVSLWWRERVYCSIGALPFWPQLPAHALLRLPCLHTLEIDQQNRVRKENVGDEELAQLTQLRRLTLGHNDFITDKGVVHLTRLHTLVLKGDIGITNAGISQLTQLTHLCLDSPYCHITDEGLTPLTNLRTLSLWRNPTVTLSGVSLPLLRELYLGRNSMVTGEAVTQYSGLTSLNLCGNSMIRGDTLGRLIHLEDLALSLISHVEEEWLSRLTALRRLQASERNLYSPRMLHWKE
jgi:Leucine-rich repeat (LRR) protein